MGGLRCAPHAGLLYGWSMVCPICRIAVWVIHGVPHMEGCCMGGLQCARIGDCLFFLHAWRRCRYGEAARLDTCCFYQLWISIEQHERFSPMSSQ